MLFPSYNAVRQAFKLLTRTSDMDTLPVELGIGRSSLWAFRFSEVGRNRAVADYEKVIAIVHYLIEKKGVTFNPDGSFTVEHNGMLMNVAPTDETATQ